MPEPPRYSLAQLLAYRTVAAEPEVLLVARAQAVLRTPERSAFFRSSPEMGARTTDWEEQSWHDDGRTNEYGWQDKGQNKGGGEWQDRSQQDRSQQDWYGKQHGWQEKGHQNGGGEWQNQSQQDWYGKGLGWQDEGQQQKGGGEWQDQSHQDWSGKGNGYQEKGQQQKGGGEWQDQSHQDWNGKGENWGGDWYGEGQNNWQNNQDDWYGKGSNWQNNQDDWHGKGNNWQNSQDDWYGKGNNWQNSQDDWYGKGGENGQGEGAGQAVAEPPVPAEEKEFSVKDYLGASIRGWVLHPSPNHEGRHFWNNPASKPSSIWDVSDEGLALDAELKELVEAGGSSLRRVQADVKKAVRMARIHELQLFGENLLKSCPIPEGNPVPESLGWRRYAQEATKGCAFALPDSADWPETKRLAALLEKD